MEDQEERERRSHEREGKGGERGSVVLFNLFIIMFINDFLFCYFN